MAIEASRRNLGVGAAVLAVLLVLGLAVFSDSISCNRLRDGLRRGQTPGSPAGGPWGQTPGSPAGVPWGQTPGSPGMRPGGQTPWGPAGRPGRAASAPGKRARRPASPMADAPPVELALESLDQVTAGMSYDEVSRIVGKPGVVLTAKGSGALIYKWEESGVRFLARFEDGKLARKNVTGGDAGVEASSAVITQEHYEQIQQGMTLDEVLLFLGIEPQAMSASGATTGIYRWADKHGSSFSAKFADGRLVRKTGMHVAALPRQDAPAEASEVAGSASGLKVAQAAVHSEEEPSRSAAARGFVADEAVEPPVPARAAPVAPAPVPRGETARSPSQPRITRVSGGGNAAKSSRVRVAGRGSQEHRERRASLPDYSHSLRRGVYEVRINNTSASAVTAGLRAGKRGRDVTIPGGTARSVRVDQGDYEFYFIYADSPYELHRGQPLRIDGVYRADIDVTLIEERADVR